MGKEIKTEIMPLVALRGLVVFPNMQLHIDVGREKSVLAIEAAMSNKRLLCLASQKDFTVDNPQINEIYSVGCVAEIKQIIHLQGNELRVIAQGLYRCEIKDYVSTVPFFQTEIVELNDKIYSDFKKVEQKALVRHTKTVFKSYAEANGKLPIDIIKTVLKINEMSNLADYIASNIALEADKKQKILEQINVVDRLETLCVELYGESELSLLEREIEAKVHKQMDDNQRDYYLHEQLKAIYDELGEGDNPQEEAQEYQAKINAVDMPEKTREKLLKEVSKLSKMPQGSHEGTVIRNYLDACVDLPFGIYTKDNINISNAQKILDRDHYGLEKVKERIVEFLAVRKMTPDITGQIICLVGPPGVGKTSIARSIAQCMGRKYARISLGGVRDEAEIRGHRKTYIGSMPGRIMDAVTRSGSSNPLILMDEIDKLGSDFRGDPSSALLEALDPEQNVEFHDHYLEIPFDLSKVLFVVTANTLDTVPPALLDRMEVISITSYTREEKFNIAKKHLITKQTKKHGLNSKNFKINNDVIYGIIDYYTREAGVRNLERVIASLCRKADKKIAGDEEQKVVIKARDLEEYLGVHKFKAETLSKKDEIGVVNGLAWTTVGGEIMQLEAGVFKGTGKVQLTGSLGDVMKESAQAAISCIRMRAEKLNVSEEFYKDYDIHIHATEGAVPKDGPSAGVAMTVALVSALTSTPIRHDVAMTGEITLRGRVLAIGGLKEKTMAAYKNGVKTVIVPKENKPDLEEIDGIVKENVKFVCADTIDEVFPVVFADNNYLKRLPRKSEKRQESKAVTSVVSKSSSVPKYCD